MSRIWAVLLSLLPGQVEILKIPWAVTPGIVLCSETVSDAGEFPSLPRTRVLDAIQRTREWGAHWSYVIEATCADRVPSLGEVWIAADPSLPCFDAGCLVGLTRKMALPDGDIYASLITIYPDQQVYDMGVIEHELLHGQGLQHICEVVDGPGYKPPGYRLCEESDRGHILHPTETSVDPWDMRGVSEALAK